MKEKKAWLVKEDEKISHYYGMLQVYPTRKLAQTNADYYNQDPLNHKMTVVPCKITY